MSDLPGMDVEALALFMTDNGVVLDGDLNVELISGGRSNLTFKASDESSAWVVRRPPTSGLTPSAHDMAREWSVTQALQVTDVPVARTVAFDPDGITLGAPMTVVEFAPGVVARSQEDIADWSDAQVDSNTCELVCVLARLHQVDFDSVGLSDFGKPTGFIERQVKTWARQWERVKTRELDDVDHLRRALQDAVPSSTASSIVHGDYRVDNVILDKSNVGIVSAVVDWEMSTLGDPLTDVALMCAYRQPVFDVVLGMNAAWTSTRYPSADDLAEMYVRESGRELKHWNFYTALANFKLAVIGEGITHRALNGADASNGASRAAEATREFAAAGLRALNTSTF
ncbi:phosphotransferase family protein [Rhodococcoides kyotonense]|uniref:Acyl-CoA dehydrogenase n=1 Tax=Rhodococcoides kyotonense TaxID=398843 RepID=A0A177YLY2_9NOCA|nr:phosphotransferase family protein [Rhodococcus kyotonensis]OAK56229.1 acyl-CoA dehydrogenase [Rhodococcus kyotonensis]